LLVFFPPAPHIIEIYSDKHREWFRFSLSVLLLLCFSKITKSR